MYLDVFHLPFWHGVGPYPSVTVRMDFSGADLGDLIYECDYIFHGDFGMRAIVEVLPNPNSASSPNAPASTGSTRPLSASAKSGMVGMEGMGAYDVAGSALQEPQQNIVKH